MTSTNKNRRFRLVWARTVIVVLWLMVVSMIIWVDPGTWWKEVVMIILMYLAIFLTVTHISRRIKMGVMGATLLVGMLVLRRLGWLDFLTGGLMLVVLGLITLIN